VRGTRFLRPFVGPSSLVLLAGALGACRTELSDAELIGLSSAATQAPVAVAATSMGHRGPPVAAGPGGPARFARALWTTFSADDALAVTVFADGFYRAPGNEGFEATLTEVERCLRAAGFGARPELELQVIETPLRGTAWTPRRARLALVQAGEERVLHAFDAPADRDRTMLPVGAPSASVEGRLVTRVEDAVAGTALLLEHGFGGAVLRKAAEQGAVLAIASDLADYNVDPSGQDRHLEAIGFRSVRSPSPIAVVQVSPRTATLLRAAAADATARVRFEAQVETAERKLRTLVATVVGAQHPGEAVPLVAHVQEPGACDNASGIGTLVEGARSLARLIEAGEVERPARSIAFVFGDEMEQSRVWLEHSGRRATAAIAADMTGESRVATGAEPLLERGPDPGALKPLPPDVHTAWGGGNAGRSEVPESDLHPNGVALVLRCALVDVAGVAGGWPTGEHPFEGGSDHVVFLEAGVPSALLWHFPDWAYHTGADRMEHVDAGEMKRTGCALLAAALALANPLPSDLERYLRGHKLEIDLRVDAALQAREAALAARWKTWGDDVRQWLRELCLGEPARLPAKVRAKPGEDT